MSDQNANHSALHLDEKESVQLARAVQKLVQELGFDPEEVDSSYMKSLAYFMKNDHADRVFRGDPHSTGQANTTE
jgi:hypothetical protein